MYISYIDLTFFTISILQNLSFNFLEEQWFKSLKIIINIFISILYNVQLLFRILSVFPLYYKEKWKTNKLNKKQISYSSLYDHELPRSPL